MSKFLAKTRTSGEETGLAETTSFPANEQAHVLSAVKAMMPGYSHSNINSSGKGNARRSWHCHQQKQMAGKNATCNLNKSQSVTNAANRC